MTHDELVEKEAKAMAESINGGVWESTYGHAAKEGWRLKAEWAMARYIGMTSVVQLEFQYHDTEYKYKNE